jgi:hypothetical protein
LNKAEEKIQEFPFDKEVRCYYPKEDPTKIIFSTDYSVTAIVLTTISSLLLYATLWYATVYYTETMWWPSMFWGSFVPFIVFLGVWTATQIQALLIFGCVMLTPLAAAIVYAIMVRIPKAEEVLRAEAIPETSYIPPMAQEVESLPMATAAATAASVVVETRATRETGIDKI